MPMWSRQPIDLRRRDRAIPRSLAEAHHLAIQAIKRLFWPAWVAAGWRQVSHITEARGQRSHPESIESNLFA